MKIGIVGLGLIGGSMAKAIKAYTPHEVYAYNRTESVTETAIREGAADQKLTGALLSECDFLLIGLYPQATVDFIQAHLCDMKRGLIIVDLCGVKKAVMYPISRISLPQGVVYIGGHPMAGIEKNGYANSFAGLFQGASMILVPPSSSEKSKPATPVDPAAEEMALTRAGELFLSLGFREITRSTPEEHDRVIAFTSQLAHVVSSSYVKSPTALEHYGFSAGSYKDLTRVARLNEVMWTELFLDNAESLTEEIDGVLQHLTEYRDAIRSGERERLRALLKDGRERKEGIDTFENS